MKYKAECPWCGKTVMMEVESENPITRTLIGKCPCGVKLTLKASAKEVTLRTS